MIRSAPSRASASAVARPIPRFAPVMRAIREELGISLPLLVANDVLRELRSFSPAARRDYLARSGPASAGLSPSTGTVSNDRYGLLEWTNMFVTNVFVRRGLVRRPDA